MQTYIDNMQIKKTTIASVNEKKHNALSYAFGKYKCGRELQLYN